MHTIVLTRAELTVLKRALLTAEAMEVGPMLSCIQDIHTKIDEQTVIPANPESYGRKIENELLSDYYPVIE